MGARSVRKMISPQGPRTGAMTSPASRSFSSHRVVPSLGSVKTIAGPLGLFYLNGRNTMISQHVGKMIAKGKRHQQHAGLDVGPHPKGNHRLAINGGQSDRPPRMNAHSVGILLAHLNETIREKAFALTESRDLMSEKMKRAGHDPSHNRHHEPGHANPRQTTVGAL